MNTPNYTTPPTSIKYWAEEDRPREKLLQQGPKALTVAELLAILISSGTPKMSALDLAKSIMSAVDNNINTLSKMSIVDLQKFNGIGKAKAVTIQAALELGRRRIPNDPGKFPILNSSGLVYNYIRGRIQDLMHEEFWILLLNRRLGLISAKRISTGGLDSTIVDVRMVFRLALEAGASSIILSHNHPSGNPTPSQHDINLTNKIKEAGKTMDIKVLDHIIACDDQYYSFMDEGLM